MNHNEEELKKQLRTLRTSASLDPQKKESIKRALRKHAAKRRWHGKVKQSVVWLSTAAALVIVSLILLNTINNNDSTLPADDHNQSEYNGTMEGRENDSFDNEDIENNETDSNDQESQQLSVNERGNETRSIMVEGIEEEVTVTNYTLEPYGINYQLGELFSNYTVDDNKVRYYNDADNAEVTLKVVEDASLENVASDIQSAYMMNTPI